jgi:disulfide bond formation protein DsbB
MVEHVIAEVLELLTLASGVVLLLLLVDYILKKSKNRDLGGIWDNLSKNFILFAFIVALASTLGSLYYSDILGYSPCVLCWWQRIFMYSQVLLFGVALVKRDRKVAGYGFAFSLVGGVLAAAHTYLQRSTLSDVGFCEAIGYSVSCSQYFGVSYGYITIPVMALTAFILIAGLCWNSKRRVV